jgi:hypothetical protein
MLSALLLTFTGVVLCYVVGVQWLGQDVLAVAQAVVATQIAGFCALLSTVNVQYIERLKFLTRGAPRTWIFFLVIYVGMTILVGPKSFNVHIYSLMAAPLILTTGLSIIVFGPIQDRIMRRRQSVERRDR